MAVALSTYAPRLPGVAPAAPQRRSPAVVPAAPNRLPAPVLWRAM